VKLGVGVIVGGGGVGEYAPAVCVSITTASCTAVVPMISTGVGVALGVQAVPIKAIATPITVMFKRFLFTLLHWVGII
jgi:hypothetical protein